MRLSDGLQISPLHWTECICAPCSGISDRTEATRARKAATSRRSYPNAIETSAPPRRSDLPTLNEIGSSTSGTLNTRSARARCPASASIETAVVKTVVIERPVSDKGYPSTSTLQVNTLPPLSNGLRMTVAPSLMKPNAACSRWPANRQALAMGQEMRSGSGGPWAISSSTRPACPPHREPAFSADTRAPIRSAGHEDRL